MGAQMADESSASLSDQRRRADGVGTGRPWPRVSAAPGAGDPEEERLPAGPPPVIGATGSVGRAK